MALIGKLDIVAGLQTSAFNTKLSTLKKSLKTGFNLDDKQAGSLAKFELGLKRQIEVFGMTSRQAEIYRLKQMGIGKEALRTAEALDKQLTKLEQAKKKQEEGGKSAQAWAASLYLTEKALGYASKGLSIFTDAIGKAASEGRLAARLGLDTQSLRAFSVAGKLAGLGADEVANSLKTLSSGIGEAAQTGVGNTALALQQLGLSADDLKSKNPDQQFRAIASALGSIPDVATKASLATSLFGDQGIALLPVLEKGGAGIDELKSKLMGFSDEQATQAQQAQAAFTMLGETWEGFTSQIAVRFAPLIADLTSGFTEWAISGTKATDAIGAGFGYLTDTFNVVSSAWYTLQSGITKGIALIARGIEKLASILPDLGFGVHDTFKAIADDLDNLASQQFAKAGKAFQAIGKSGATSTGSAGLSTIAAITPKPVKLNNSEVVATQKAFEKTLELTNSLRTATEKYSLTLKQLPDNLPMETRLRAESQAVNELFGIKTINDAKTGLSEYTKKTELLFDLWHKGAVDAVQVRKAQYQSIEGLFDSKGASEFGKELTGWIEQLRSPFSKVAEDFGNLLDASSKGLISDYEFLFASAKIHEKTFGSSTPKFAGAVDAFSQEGRSALLAATQGTSKQDALADLASISRQQLDIQRKQYELDSRRGESAPKPQYENAW